MQSGAEISLHGLEVQTIPTALKSVLKEKSYGGSFKVSLSLPTYNLYLCMEEATQNKL